MNDIAYSIKNQTYHSDFKYLVSPTEFKTLQESILNGNLSSWSITDLFDNASDYLISYTYYPIKLDLFLNYTAQAKFIIGKVYLDSGQENRFNRIDSTNNFVYWFVSPTITRTHNNFLDYEPYTKKTLYCPFFEPIDLPLNMVYGKNVYGELSLDIRTGNLTLVVYTYSGNEYMVIATRKCKIGIDLPMGKTNREDITRNNLLQSISLVGSAAAIGVGAAMGNAPSIVGGVALATRSTTQLIANNVEHLKSYKGADGNSSMLNIDTDIKIYTETVKGTTAIDTHLVGKPLRQYMDFSNLTGFTKASNITLGTPITSYGKPVIMDDEMTELNTLLESGIWLNFNDYIS